MRTKLIYVAGPVGANDRGRLDRVHAAIDTAEKIARLGCSPFVPHFFHWWDQRHPHDYEHWMAECFTWLEQCDGLYRMTGESPGADREVVRALELGMPVFKTLAEVAEWAALP